VPDALRLHVNRQELHSLEVPDSFEAHDSFDVVLVNHGEAVHVHLHLDDGLAAVGALEANNHYVQANTERRVHVAVNGEPGVHGKLKVVTGYGATTRYVDIDIVEPEQSTETVQVGEELSRPQPIERTERSDPLVERSTTPVFLLAGVALLLAVAAVALIDSTAIALGAIAVIIAVLVATYVLVFD